MAIDNDVLASIVSRELDAATTWMNSELAPQQADNLKYYNAEPFGNEKPGHSQVVTRDVLETIEGIMPTLMRLFAGQDSVVEFEPEGPEDEEGAEQATDYLNYVFMRRLDGFKILYNWFKDALLVKNSVIKVGWAAEDIVEFDTFDNLTIDEKDALLIASDDEDVEIVDEEENEDGSFRCRVRRIIYGGQPYIEMIPTEEFRINERAKCIKSADFVAHVTNKTIGELLEAGFTREDVEGLGKSVTVDGQTVKEARFSDPKESSGGDDSDSPVKEDRQVEIVEAYIRTFDDEEERPVLMRVLYGGNKVLESEEVDHAPLINLSPIMMPHKFTGIAEADLVRDIQEINTAITRQILDNLALQNAGRYAAIEGQVNLQDALENKIGGIVRMKSMGAFQRLDTPQLSQHTLPMLERLDLNRENRTGVSRMTQGLDPNALTSNTAATAVNQVMTAAQEKILLIARIFAETGVKDLMWELYELVRTNQQKPDIVKLRGRYVEVSPFDWKDRKDMTVTVGIGNGNKDQQLFHLNNMAQLFQQIGNTQYNYLLTADNVYSLAAEFVKNSGYKNVDKFISSPSAVQPPEPQPDPLTIAAQAEAERDKAEMELKRAQLEFEREKFQWQKAKEAAELQIDAAKVKDSNEQPRTAS